MSKDFRCQLRHRLLVTYFKSLPREVKYKMMMMIIIIIIIIIIIVIVFIEGI